MDIRELLSPILSLFGTALTAFFALQAQRYATRVARDKNKTEVDSALRDDLMQIVDTMDKRNKELQETNQKQQEFIDQERNKRRMQEMENDHLARENSRIKYELESLKKQLEQQNERIKELEKIIASLTG